MMINVNLNYEKFYKIINSDECYKILGLDVSKNRIGVAIFSNASSMAFPVSTITRMNFKKDIASIVELIKTNNAFGTVIGLPINLNCAITESTEIVLNFAEKLKQQGIVIALHDERFTTSFANTLLQNAKSSKKHMSKIKDQIAARLILESFVGMIKNNNLMSTTENVSENV